MAQNTIAVICDCDATLAPDTTGQFLEFFGVDQGQFFKETADLVIAGWDPTLAFLQHIIDLTAPGQPLEGVTKDKIEEVGCQLTFYSGVPEVFQSLKAEIEGEQRFRDVGIRVETYVVSSGIEELLAASILQGAVHSIWGSSFSYDGENKLSRVKRAISFTDKTRSIFLIQKGKISVELRANPYVVNEPMGSHERPVPFENMVYVGDGPSDIPCMSLIQTFGGYVIGILSDDNPAKTWALGYGRRANITVPPDYAPQGYAYKQLYYALKDRAEDIRNNLLRQRPTPGY